MASTETVDIRPQTDIYETYRRLSYKAWSAIAELVDNSTASYFLHRDKLSTSSSGGPDLLVDIFYDRKEGCLTIVDNAFGMNLAEFRRSLMLAKPPAYTGGRSEFGMGLKTSACWLGPRWTVTSKQLGATSEYSATIDVNRFREEKPNSLTITIRDDLPPEEHYTRVEIFGMNDYSRTFQTRTIGRIKSELRSIYRRDLISGRIGIVFNGEKLEYRYPGLLPSIGGGEWMKPFEFSVQDRLVSGWIGILGLDDAGAANAGFDIFRRDRLITGGAGQSWKPWEIFKAPNSFQSQRLTGELNLNDWPVSHTKDQIEFSGSEEEELLANLREVSIDYISKAKESRTPQQPGLSRAAVEAVVDDTRTEWEANEAAGAEIMVLEAGVLPAEPTVDDEILSERIDSAGGAITIHFGGQSMPELRLGFSDASASDPLVQLGFPSDTTIEMLLNLAHPFIDKFVGKDEGALKLLVHTLYVDALTERITRHNSEASPGQIRSVRESLLRSLRPLEI